MRAFAYIAFFEEHVATHLIDELNGLNYCDQLLTVELYKSPNKRYKDWSENKHKNEVSSEVEDNLLMIKDLLARCVSNND